MKKYKVILLLSLVFLVFMSSCQKDDDDNDNDDIQTVTDYDGNKYQTVMIGNQVWMTENLKTIHYADGTSIPLVEDNGAWDDLGYTDKAYCYYDNSSSNGNTYGALYSWAAAMNGEISSNNNPSDVQGVCPDGWHLPSDNEWKELEMFLGMSQESADSSRWRGTDEGGKLKETGYEHWIDPNTGATNESGFTALAGGWRDTYGDFNYLDKFADFWSATEVDSSNVWFRDLGYSYSEIWRNNDYKNYGSSVRCLKD